MAYGIWLMAKGFKFHNVVVEDVIEHPGLFHELLLVFTTLFRLGQRFHYNSNRIMMFSFPYNTKGSLPDNCNFLQVFVLK